MKFSIIVFSILFSHSLFARDYVLSQGTAGYTVKHLVKTVKGESKELKGKMVCANTVCEFLVAAPVKSFISSDSNRDLNMQTILEAVKYPLVTAKGKLAEADLSKDNFEMKAIINFHGIEKEYLVKMQKSGNLKGTFTLMLEDHKVERPSLLTVSIDNEVPMDLSFEWK